MTKMATYQNGRVTEWASPKMGGFGKVHSV